MNAKAFLDTNIIVYAFSTTDRRAPAAHDLLKRGGLISVQVLNEFVRIARSKLGMSWDESIRALVAIRSLCPVVTPLTLDLHEAALLIAQRFGYGIFDSLIIAAATEGRCDILYSEDLQHNQNIGGLRIVNPFLAP
jgi:predicted nucleic acid-binding protein